MQGAAPIAASNLGFRHAGLPQGGIRSYSDKRIEPRIQLLDSSQTVYSQVDRRKRAFAEQFADLPDRLLQAWFLPPGILSPKPGVGRTLLSPAFDLGLSTSAKESGNSEIKSQKRRTGVSAPHSPWPIRMAYNYSVI